MMEETRELIFDEETPLIFTDDELDEIEMNLFDITNTNPAPTFKKKWIFVVVCVILGLGFYFFKKKFF